MRFLKHIFILFFLLIVFKSQAQENAWEDMLKKEVEVLNPNYKPVVGAGLSMFSFRGDVKNSTSYPFIGNMGYKINIHTYLDPNRYFKANLYAYIGETTVNQQSVIDSANINFRSDLVMFGANIHYDFRHFLKKDQFITPFVSVGVEYVHFSSKADLGNNKGTYNYWADGTIRNQKFPYNYGDANTGILHRDYTYETDLRRENLKDPAYKNYSQGTIAFPLEVGLDLFISNRSYLRFAFTYHYTLSDYIDNVAATNTPIKGDSKSDAFITSSITAHFDLFSDPKTRIQNLLFADVDFDYTMYSDEDGDMIFDGWDQCPATPANIPVDTLGCPYDADKDGVFDYKDKEAKSRNNAIVDINGVEITDDTVFYFFNKHEIVPRDQVDFYLKLYNSQSPRSMRKKISDLPERFKSVDANKDSYISYEEVLSIINSFYEFETKLSYKDIEELIEFLFSQ